MRRHHCGFALLLLTAALTAAPAEAACARATAERSGRWFTARPPMPWRHDARRALDGGGATVHVAAMDPASRTTLFVSNGEHVLRSNDGGCSWMTVYALDAPSVTGADGALGDITGIDVARVQNRTRVLLVARAYTHPAQVRTVVVRSDDGYTGWEVVTDPVAFPPTTYAGGAVPMVRSGGGVAYVAYPGPDGRTAYARSSDGGQTWARRTPLPDATAPGSIQGFAVSPYDPDDLWEWGGGPTGLRRSTDGAGSWMTVDAWPAYDTDPSFVTADVAWPRRGAPARVAVAGSVGGRDGGHDLLAWSGDGGRTFQTALPPLKTVELYDAALTHLPGGHLVVVTDGRLTYLVPHRGRTPVRADWRALPQTPERPSAFAARPAFASATRPTGVAVASSLTLQLLVVR